MTSDNSETGESHFKNKLKSLFQKQFNKKTDSVFTSRAYENLDTPRQDMIKGVIELSSHIARDIMIPRVDIFAVDSKTNLKPLVKMICDAGHSRVPVFEDTIDNINGILYVKDLLNLLIDTSKKKLQLKKILHETYFVPETMLLYELLLEFKVRKLHIAVVVDEYGGVAGIVTLEDILEEIVGEIDDEFDNEEPPEFEKKGKNTYEVDSRMLISDLNHKLKLRLSTEDFDTIGGYVFDLFGKIPEKDEETTHDNLVFKIKDISGTVINRIIITVKSSK